MPIHALPHLLSWLTPRSSSSPASAGTSAQDPPASLAEALYQPHILYLTASIASVLALRRWSAGKDLIARLYIRARERQREVEARGGQDAHHDLPLQPERDLHGTTFLVVCTLTPASLLVVSSLASRGAQVVLLLPLGHTVRSDDGDDADEASAPAPTPAQATTMQYLSLLRSGTSNALIFAEECDVLSLASIQRFCASWAEGEVSPGAAMPGSAKSARRCDGVVLLPYGLEQLRASARRAPQNQGAPGLTPAERQVMGRFHLLNALLPSLLQLPPERDIRILHWVSPWYAAGVRRFQEGEWARVCAQGSTAPGPSTTAGSSATALASRRENGGVKRRGRGQQQAHTAPASAQRSHSTLALPSVSETGALQLTSLLLLHELQRRLLLLAEADPRPRNPLPGIIPRDASHGHGSANAPLKALPNVNVINVCPGFERDGEVWERVWPRRSVGGRVSDRDGTANAAATLLLTLRRCAVLALWPLLFLLSKSPKAAVDQFMWGVVAPLDVAGGCRVIGEMARRGERARQGGGQAPTAAAAAAAAAAGPTFGANTHTHTRTHTRPAGESDARPPQLPARETPRQRQRQHASEEDEDEDSPLWRGIQPARLYREGRIVRLSLGGGGGGGGGDAGLDPWSAEGLAGLWDVWEGRVREGLKVAAEEGMGEGV